MKTFVVESTKAVVSKTLVKAETAKQAREAVKNGTAHVESFVISQNVSNTVNDVREA